MILRKNKYYYDILERKIPTKFLTIKLLSLQEYLIYCNDKKNLTVTQQCWVNLIKNKKLVCPVTNRKVSYVALEEILKRNKRFQYYNFYSKDGYLFTIDHIIPKSLGGSKRKIENIQPMIWSINLIKSDINNDLFENFILPKIKCHKIFKQKIGFLLKLKIITQKFINKYEK
jgi:hypothetical protein